MRILIVGDQHFRYELPYSAALSDGRRSEWEDVKATIIEAAQKCDAVVLMGDNLNSRHNHSSVLTEFVEFLGRLDGGGKRTIHIIAGNHERYGASTALDFLHRSGNKNWRVYTSVEQHIQFPGGKTATFIPYMTPALLGYETHEGGGDKLISGLEKDDFAFVHHAISDTHGVEAFSEIILPRDKLEPKFGHVFGGHIHDFQEISDRTLVTGSIFTSEIGEHEKFVHIFDGTDTEQVQLPVRGIYGVAPSDATNMFVHIPDHSIVKCTIRNRDMDLQLVQKNLERFDAYVIVEQYERTRERAVSDTSALDLSIESLLKTYAEQKQLDLGALHEGLNLVRSYDQSKRILAS